MESFVKKIEDLIAAGWSLEKESSYDAWCGRVKTFLSAAVDRETADIFQSLRYSYDTAGNAWYRALERQIGYLEGMSLRIESRGLEATERSHSAEQCDRAPIGSALSRVFLVHGHDEAAKETTARFIEKLGLEAVILSEQANEGRTVIEKFEVLSDVGFAVALFTPDDVGAAKSDPNKLNGRARQNVVLELGYFCGRLGRSKVCALYKPGVERPSDLHGVLFLELDSPGAWKAKLAQELVHAGMRINLQGLLTA